MPCPAAAAPVVITIPDEPRVLHIPDTPPPPRRRTRITIEDDRTRIITIEDDHTRIITIEDDPTPLPSPKKRGTRLKPYISVVPLAPREPTMTLQLGVSRPPPRTWNCASARLIHRHNVGELGARLMDHGYPIIGVGKGGSVCFMISKYLVVKVPRLDAFKRCMRHFQERFEDLDMYAAFPLGYASTHLATITVGSYTHPAPAFVQEFLHIYKPDGVLVADQVPKIRVPLHAYNADNTVEVTNVPVVNAPDVLRMLAKVNSLRLQQWGISYEIKQGREGPWLVARDFV